VLIQIDCVGTLPEGAYGVPVLKKTLDFGSTFSKGGFLKGGFLRRGSGNLGSLVMGKQSAQIPRRLCPDTT
jgi:hypothetical protein